MVGKQFDNKKVFKNELTSRAQFSSEQIFTIFRSSAVDSIRVDTALVFSRFTEGELTQEQYQAIRLNHGATFRHRIDFEHSVFGQQAAWSATGSKPADRRLAERKATLIKLFTIQQPTQ
jgi:hypothetical protein